MYYYVIYRKDNNGLIIPFASSRSLETAKEYIKTPCEAMEVRTINAYTLIALKSAHFIIDLDK